MGVHATDKILGPPRGTAAAAIAFATSNGAARLGDATQLIRTYYSVCPKIGMDPAIVVAAAFVETGNFTNRWWRERLNAGSLGVTGDPKQNEASPTFATPQQAAEAHAAHLLVYAVGPSRASDRWDAQIGGVAIEGVDPRYDAYWDAFGDVAKAPTIAGLAGTYAADRNYASAIVERAVAVYGSSLPDQTGDTMPYSTPIPGLPGGPLGTDYPIRVQLMELDGFQRPGDKARRPRRCVQHGTGNPSNASAAAEARYFINGAEGRQASVHACADDREVWVIVPLDEVTWQAADGSGPGNMNGYSCEMMEATSIWNDPARRDRLIAITADFMGRVGARLGVAVPERHWDFNAGSADRHHCPNMLMNTGLWDSMYVPLWQKARADELKRMGEDPPAPVYAKKYPLSGEVRLRKVNGKVYVPVADPNFVAVDRTERRQFATPDAAIVGPDYQPGDKATLHYATAGEDAETWLVGRGGVRARASAFVR